jgi:hypothetical protein
MNVLHTMRTNVSGGQWALKEEFGIFMDDVGTYQCFFRSFFPKQPVGPPLCSACGAHLAKSKQAGVGALCGPTSTFSLYQTGCHLKLF